MIHTVYKTTNLLNGKIYIGYHLTVYPADDYIGSGKLLKRAIKKYGRQYFCKEVLECFDNAEAALTKEAELVNEAFCADPMTYNVTVGGGVPPNRSQWWTEEHSETARARMVGNNHKLGFKESDHTKFLKKEAFAKSTTHAAHTKNKSVETCSRISIGRIGKGRGGRNAMANPLNVDKVRQSKIGLKKLVKGDVKKMAHPDSDKWAQLMADGFREIK